MTLIIAEAGVNHNGEEALAFKLVDAAYAAGADIIKFQTFKAINLVTASVKQAEYQVTNTQKVESQLDMLSRLELSYDAHHKLVKYCDEIGIEFLSTAFDSESLDFLVNDLGLTRLKIPSGEITNAPLVLEHALTGCDLIVSTGMASLAEIEDVLGVIAFGYITKGDISPSIEAFSEAYFSKEGQLALKTKVTILHCTTEYPAPIEDINLLAMDSIKAAFRLPVGYSDHSEGITIPIAAVARGATIIEKHFTLDKNMDGPDHKASLNPQELLAMVSSIRSVNKALGDGIKGPRPSEIANKKIARKSLIAKVAISKGDIFTIDNIDAKRAGSGVSPKHYWRILGEKSQDNYHAGDILVINTTIE